MNFHSDFLVHLSYVDLKQTLNGKINVIHAMYTGASRSQMDISFERYNLYTSVKNVMCSQAKPQQTSMLIHQGWFTALILYTTKFRVSNLHITSTPDATNAPTYSTKGGYPIT